MMGDFLNSADYLRYRSYMYRRMGLPRQSYILRRMASRREARDA